MNSFICYCSFFIARLYLNNGKSNFILISYRQYTNIDMEDTPNKEKKAGCTEREEYIVQFKKKRGRKPNTKEQILPILSSERHQESPKEITPAFELCEPKVRKRTIKDLPAGYHRYNQPAFPPRNYIELTENDYHFIESEQKKYRYYDFYLLTPDRLIKAYIFLSSIQYRQYSGQQSKEKLKQQLLDYNQELSYAIFELLKTQSPQLFEAFVEMLFKRWQYRFKQSDYFRPNAPQRLCKDTQTYITKKPTDRIKSVKFLRRAQLKLVNTSLQLLDTHSSMRASHEGKKQELTRFLLGFFRDISLINSEIVFEPIKMAENEVTLIDLDKKLRNLIQQLRKWKKTQEVLEPTSLYCRSQGNIIPNLQMQTDNLSQISKN